MATILSRMPESSRPASSPASRTPPTAAARLLSITGEGQRIRLDVQTEIQANENRILSRLPAADRQGFLRAARALSALPPEEFTRSDALGSTVTDEEARRGDR